MKANFMSIYVTCLTISLALGNANAKTAADSVTFNSKYKFTYSWRTEAKMLVPRSDGSATPTESEIIIAGGCIGKQVKFDWGYGCDTITDSSSAFNPSTGTFTALPSMPRKRYRHTAVNVNNKIYVMGGTNLDYPEPVLASIDVFDVTTKKWSTLPTKFNLPFPTTDSTSFAISSKIYFTGGYETTNYTSFGRTWVYDVTSNVGWKEVASAPSDRGDAVGVTIEGIGYVFGGFTHYNQWSEPVGTLESYSPVDDKWTTLKSMPTARGDKAGAVLHNRFHVIGGETKNKDGHSVPIRDVEVYDPVEKTWQDEGSIPSERFRFMAAGFGDVIYIFGGQQFLVGEYGKSGSYYPVSDQVEAFIEKKLGITDVDKDASGSSTLSITMVSTMLMVSTMVGSFW